MEDRLAGLERKVGELAGAMSALERRLVAVESRAAAPAAAASEAFPDAGDADVAAGPVEAGGVTLETVLTLVGGLCLVLVGAYELRALTEGGTLSRRLGTLLGIAYAVVWLVLADRLDSARRRLVAPFLGAATALVAFPLLWEAGVRAKSLSPEQAALSMAGVTSLAFLVAWRRRIQSLAWIITMAALVATLLFFAGLGTSVPFGFYLAFLGVVTLWMGYTLDWIWLRWPVAFVADFTVVVMAAWVTEPFHRDGAGAVMLLQLVMFGAYLVSIAARTLWRSRDVIPFEVVQTVALLGVAFGGAVYVMRATGAGATGLGIAALVFGVGSYGVAFAFVDWRRGSWKNFAFYTALAVVFMLSGLGLVVDVGAEAMVWAGLAVASAAVGYRYAAVAIGAHSAIYLVAAAMASGLLGHISDAFMGSAARAWEPLSGPALVVLAGAAVCCAIPFPAGPGSWGRYSRLPKLVTVITLLLGVGGVLIGQSVPVLSGPAGAGADAAVVAAVRTVVLGGAVLLLAFVGGRGIFAEGRWLMYIVLVIGGVKLLVEDIPAGRPATMVLSLGAYGAALIVAPRWARRQP